MRRSTATSRSRRLRSLARGRGRTALVLGTNLVLAGGALGWVLHRHGGAALAILGSGPRPALLAGFAIAVVGAFAGYARRWQLLLEGLGVRAGLATLVAYRAAGQSLSALIPSGNMGGEPLRALLLARAGARVSSVMASVAVDRALELASNAPFVCLYGMLLVRAGIPELQGALVTATLGAVAVAVGIGIAVRRLRDGSGLVTALARSTRLDRLQLMHGHLALLEHAEVEAGTLVDQAARLRLAFAASVAINLLVVIEYRLLLSSFGLPAGFLAIAAAIFATGVAHSLPVPAAVGTLEGTQMWLFELLGYPADIGLAVGLAVRLRELVWIAPGLVYLMVRALRSSDRRRPHTAAARKPG